MTEFQTQIEKKHSNEEQQSYDEYEISQCEYAHGVTVWREKKLRYDFEGLEPTDQIDRQKVKALFEKKDLVLKPSLFLLNSLSESALLRLVSESNSIITKSRAIEELLKRESVGLRGILVQELAKDNLPSSWRNTLLLTTEHVQFTETSHREQLQECLKSHSKDMKDEWHPRTHSALRASLRVLLSLMADWHDLPDLLPFLTLAYPVRIKRIVLLGIQDIFRDVPPPPDAVETLTPVRKAIKIIAESYLTPIVYDESEDEFDLGLDAIDTLIQLADQSVPDIIECARQFAGNWAIKHIWKNLCKTHEVWTEEDFANKQACLEFIVNCKSIIDQE